MARILTRPLFRKGGLSRETGIMSGLDRRGYAQGSYAPRVGYAEGPRIYVSDLDKWKQRIRGTSGGIWDAIKKQISGTTGTQSGSKIASDAASKVSKWSKAKDLLKSPKFSERGLLEAIKKYGPKALKYGKTGIMGAASRFPLLTTAAGIYGAGTPTPVDVKYDITRGENIFPMFGDTKGTLEKKIERNLAEAANPNNPWRYDSGKYGPRKEHPDYDPEKSSWFPWSKGAAETELEEDKVPKKKIIESDIDTPTTGDVESDFERIYKERLPTIEKALAGRPSTKSQWLALAKFGTGLMAQPGGDLIGAIGKASQIPLDDLAKLQEKMEDKKTSAKMLALQSALDETKPGDIAKKARDVKKLLGLKGAEGDKAAFAVVNKWLANDRTYKAAETESYRKVAEGLDVNSAGFIESMDELKEKHPKLLNHCPTLMI